MEELWAEHRRIVQSASLDHYRYTYEDGEMVFVGIITGYDSNMLTSASTLANV